MGSTVGKAIMESGGDVVFIDIELGLIPSKAPYEAISQISLFLIHT